MYIHYIAKGKDKRGWLVQIDPKNIYRILMNDALREYPSLVHAAMMKINV